jgi:hypothetical protein
MHELKQTGGASHSDDGRLRVGLSQPGSSGQGTNPEQFSQPVGLPAEVDARRGRGLRAQTC